jgi:hypothetical protein
VTKKSERQKQEEYQQEATYWGKEDPSPVGRKAVKAAEEAIKESRTATLPRRGDKLKESDMAAVNAARKVVEQDKEQREPYERMNAMGDTYKRGGKVSASKRADGIAQRGKTRGQMR